MKMEQKQFEDLAYIISSIVCLSDLSQTPLPQLTKAIGRDNLDVIVEQAFLESFMGYDDMAFEINRYCGLELPMDNLPREEEELKWVGISLAGMVGAGADLYTVLSTPLPELVSPARPAKPEGPEKLEKPEFPVLHVVIDYFPWRTQEGILRFQMLEIFDIRTDANTIEEGKEQLAILLTEYAREYASKGYDQDFRRRHHQPYVARALQLGTPQAVQEMMLVFLNEQAVREAMVSPSKNMQRLSSDVVDEFYEILIGLWAESGFQWGMFTEDEKIAFDEQAFCEIERRYREGEGRCFTGEE